MIPSKLLFTVAYVLDACEAAGPEAPLGDMVNALRVVQDNLRATLVALDVAAEDEDARQAAMHAWNEHAMWAEMLINSLCDILHESVPI